MNNKRQKNCCRKYIEATVKQVVQDELQLCKKEEHPALSSQELQDIIANAIIQADEQRTQMNRDKIKNSKLSAGTIIAIVVFGIISFFLLVLAVSAFFADNDLSINAMTFAKLFLLSITYALFAYAQYAVGKNKSSTFGFNVLSVLIGVVAIVISLIS